MKSFGKERFDLGMILFVVGLEKIEKILMFMISTNRASYNILLLKLV